VRISEGEGVRWRAMVLGAKLVALCRKHTVGQACYRRSFRRRRYAFPPRRVYRTRRRGRGGGSSFITVDNIHLIPNLSIHFIPPHSPVRLLRGPRCRDGARGIIPMAITPCSCAPCRLYITSSRRGVCAVMMKAMFVGDGVRI
jgi:hypothetical protein